MSLRLKRMFKNWTDSHESVTNTNTATFSAMWVDDLQKTLFRHRHDKEFVLKVIESASIFFSESLTDQEKHDAFFFLLGKTNRRK